MSIQLLNFLASGIYAVSFDVNESKKTKIEKYVHNFWNDLNLYVKSKNLDSSNKEELDSIKSKYIKIVNLKFHHKLREFSEKRILKDLFFTYYTSLVAFASDRAMGRKDSYVKYIFLFLSIAKTLVSALEILKNRYPSRLSKIIDRENLFKCQKIIDAYQVVAWLVTAVNQATFSPNPLLETSSRIKTLKDSLIFVIPSSLSLINAWKTLRSAMIPSRASYYCLATKVFNGFSMQRKAEGKDLHSKEWRLVERNCNELIELVGDSGQDNQQLHPVIRKEILPQEYRDYPDAFQYLSSRIEGLGLVSEGSLNSFGELNVILEQLNTDSKSNKELVKELKIEDLEAYLVAYQYAIENPQSCTPEKWKIDEKDRSDYLKNFILLYLCNSSIHEHEKALELISLYISIESRNSLLSHFREYAKSSLDEKTVQEMQEMNRQLTIYRNFLPVFEKLSSSEGEGEGWLSRGVRQLNQLAQGSDFIAVYSQLNSLMENFQNRIEGNLKGLNLDLEKLKENKGNNLKLPTEHLTSDKLEAFLDYLELCETQRMYEESGDPSCRASFRTFLDLCLTHCSKAQLEEVFKPLASRFHWEPGGSFSYIFSCLESPFRERFIEEKEKIRAKNFLALSELVNYIIHPELRKKIEEISL